MISKKLHTKIRIWVAAFERFVDRWWYVPTLSLLAALDNLIVVIPTDGLLISSSMITPHRWLRFAVSVAVGSTAGAMVLAALVHRLGMPWILEFYPGVQESSSWVWTLKFLDGYGLLLVFAVALTPLMQQPVVILTTLAGTSYVSLAAVILAGRGIKYLGMSYIASHAPKLLNKLWGVKDELEDVGVHLEP